VSKSACYASVLVAAMLFALCVARAFAEPHVGVADRAGARGVTSDTSSWERLLGTPAQPWHAEHWINSEALDLSQLKGRVVLVRWWTAPDCPFCSATAPSLNTFHERYASRGLSVVGFYHHKARSPLSFADVERYAQTFKFQFPVAVDLDWSTLRAWWLADGRRPFTSVSFLIDRRGIIRHIHPGGQYVKGDADYAKLESMIEKLLNESR
jgi:thiol-disulfide isomerase/thioredoxin